MWQTIDSAPKDGREFLAYWSNMRGAFEFIQPMKWHEGKFVISWDHDDDIDPTHWMPLPEGPK